MQDVNFTGWSKLMTGVKLFIIKLTVSNENDQINM